MIDITEKIFRDQPAWSRLVHYLIPGKYYYAGSISDYEKNKRQIKFNPSPISLYLLISGRIHEIFTGEELDLSVDNHIYFCNIDIEIKKENHLKFNYMIVLVPYY